MAHPIDASGLRRSQSGVGIAPDERGVVEGRELAAGRAARTGKRVCVRRAHMVGMAAAMVVRIPFVGIGSDLIAVAIDVRRGFVLTSLDARADLCRMRHPDPGGQDEHQTGKEG